MATDDELLRILAEVEVRVNDQQARNTIRRLAADERNAAGGAGQVVGTNRTPAANAIAMEIAEVRKQADLNLSALRRAKNLGITETAGRKLPDPESYARAANANITRLINQVTRGERDPRTQKRIPAMVDPELAKEVRSRVSSPAATRRLYQQRDYELGTAEASRIRQDPVYAGQRAADKVRVDAEAETQRLRAGRQSPDFINSLGALDVETRRFAGTMSGWRLQSEEYKAATTEGTVLNRQLNAAIRERAAADRRVVEAAAQDVATRGRLRDKATLTGQGRYAETRGLSDDDLRRRAASARLDQRAGDKRAIAQDPAAIDQRAGLRASNDLIRARMAEARMSGENLDAEREKRNATKALNDTLRAQAAGYSDEDIERMGTQSAGATATFINAQTRRGVVANNITDQQIRQAAEDRAAMAKTNNAIKAREKQIVNQMIQEGEMGGTWLQRRVAQWSPGIRTPSDVAAGPENLKAKAVTTIGYAASAVGANFLFQGITGAVKEASQLQSTFVRLQGQMTALGRGEEFDGMRDRIKALSTETGIAATDVAEFTSRMLGVFRDQGTEYALRQTEEAMKLMVVTGIDLKTTIQSVIPTAKAFNVEVAEIGDVAVQTGELLGISEEQVVEFLGKSATVAKQAGLSMRETTALGATMAQNLGKDLSSSADVLNKMPELVQRNQAEIFNILRQAPATKPYVEEMQENLRQGKPGQASLALFRAVAIPQDQGGINPKAVPELAKLIGNAREVEDVTSLLTNAVALVVRLTEAQEMAGKSTGAMDSRFEKLKNTVSQTFERIQRAIESFAETLFELGIAEAFSQIGKAAEIALGSIGLIVKAITTLNNMTKVFGFDTGVITPLIGIGVQIAIITKALGYLDKLRIKMLGTSTVTGQSEKKEAGDRTINTGAIQRESLSLTELNALKAREAALSQIRATTASTASLAGLSRLPLESRLALAGANLPRPTASPASLLGLGNIPITTRMAAAGSQLPTFGTDRLLQASALSRPPTSVATAFARYGGLTGAVPPRLPAGTNLGQFLLGATPQVGGGVTHATNYARFGNLAGVPLQNRLFNQGALVQNQARYATETAALGALPTQRAGLAFGDAASGRLITASKQSAGAIGESMSARFVAAQGLLAQTNSRMARESSMAGLSALRGLQRANAKPGGLFTGLGGSLQAWNNRPINQDSFMYRLGARGSTDNYASWTSRAFSGGSTAGWNPLRNATASANQATAAAGRGQGIVGSGMVLPAAAITLVGAAAVKSAWEEQSQATEAAANDFRERAKTASRERLQEIVDEGHSTLDQIGNWVLRQDLPDEIAKAGIRYQESKPAADKLAALDKAGVAETFNKRVGENKEALDKLAGYFTANQDLADEIGAGYNPEGPRTPLPGPFNIVGRAFKGTPVRQIGAENIPKAKALAQKLLASKDARDQQRGADLAKLLGEDILNQPGFEDLKAAAERGVYLTEFQQKVEDAGGAAKFARERYDAAKKDYEGGALTTGGFLAEAKQARAEAQGNTAGMTPEQKKEADAAIQEMDNEIRGMTQDALKKRVDLAVSIARITGRRDVEQYAFKEQLRVLPQYDQRQQVEMLPELLSQAEKAFQEQLSLITDPVKRAQARMAGFKLPPEIQELQIIADVRLDPDIGAGLKSLEASLGMGTDQLVAWVAKRVRETNMSVVDIVTEALEQRRQALLAEAERQRGEGTLSGLFQAATSEQEADKKLNEEASAILSIGGGDVQQLFGGAAGYFNLDTQGFAKMVAEKAHEWNVSTAEAVLRILKERRDKAIEAGASPDDPALQFLDQLINAAEGTDYGSVTQGTDQVQQPVTRDSRGKELSDITDERKADLDIAAQTVRGDDMAQKMNALNQAEIDYANQLILQGEGLDNPAERKRAYLNLMKARADVEDSARSSSLIRFDFQELEARGDPVAENAARLGKAREVLQNAIADAGGNMKAESVQKALLDVKKLEEDGLNNQIAITRSNFSLMAAQVGRDPLAVARVAQQQARFELEQAKGKADENEKAAALIRADQGVEDAMSAIYDSRANLAIALAEAAGDPVKAAKIAMDEAKRKLDEAVRQGRGESEVNQLKGAFATTTEAYYKTGRDREEQIIDFQLQMGQITTQTAIESLRLILARTREGTDEYMQLALKIRQLEQQAGQDLQFNLPTSLGLPTLYESRRVAQSTMAGMGYQDNRNIVLSVNVNGAQDPMAVTNQIMSAFSSAVGTANTHAPLSSGVNW